MKIPSSCISDVNHYVTIFGSTAVSLKTGSCGGYEANSALCVRSSHDDVIC